MAGNVNVANAQVTLYPGLASGWHASLQQQLNHGTPFNIQVHPVLNNSQINGAIGQTQARINVLGQAFTAAFAALSARALSEKIKGLSGISNKITEITAAATSAAGAATPLLGLVGGLGAGFAVAGAGLGAFAALAKPQLTAITDGVKAAGQSQDAYNTALAGMTPLQQEATKATVGLKDAFKAQSDAFAPVTLGLYTQGIQTLTGLLPALTPIAQAAGSALQGIMTQAQAGLAGALGPGGGLGQFLTTVQQQIGPVLQGIAPIVVNVGRTLSNVFQAAVPLIQPVLGLFQQLTGALSGASGGGGLASFFQSLIPLIQPLGAALQSVSGALGGLLKAAVPLAGPILGAIQALGDALKSLFASADFTSFVQSVASAIGQLGPLFQSLVGPLGKVVSTIAGQFAQLLPQLIPVIEQFANVFANVLVGLSPLLPLFAQLAGILVDFLPVLYPIIQAFRQALAPVLQAVGQTLIAILPAVQDMVQAFTPLLPLFGQLLAAIVPVVGQLIGALLPVLTALFNAVKPLIPVITQVATVVGNFFADAIGLVLKAIVPLLPPLARLASQILTALLKVFIQMQPSLTQIIKSFVGLLPALLPLVEAATRIVLAFLPMLPMFTRLVAVLIPPLIAIVRALAGILSWLAGVAATVTEGLVTVFTHLGQVWGFIWNAMKTVITGAWGAIKGTATAIWNGLVTIFTTIKNAVVGIWDGMWDGIKLVVVTAWNAISGFFTNTIAPAFASLWQGLVDVAQTVWGGIKDVFAAPVNAVILPIIRNFAHAVDAVSDFVAGKRPLQSWENIPDFGAANKFAVNPNILAPGTASTGTIVPGGYGGGDRVPYLLEPGEVVVRKEGAAAYPGGPTAMHRDFNLFGSDGNAPYGPKRPLPLGTGGPKNQPIHASGTVDTSIGNLIGSTVSGLAGDVFDVGKWILNQAQHWLRVGAANAFDQAYKAFSAPLYATLPNTGWAQTPRGMVDKLEQSVFNWIRGNEHEEPVVTGDPGLWTGGQLTWPVPGYYGISQYFGSHPGIDIPAPIGTTIVAANEGQVVSSGPASGFGNWIRILGQGVGTVYGHMSANNLFKGVGDFVKAGDRIAGVGSEGNSTGPHLHFEVHPGGFGNGPTDPVPYLRGNVPAASDPTVVGHHDRGGLASGWSWVGETKPELVHFNSASRVLSNRDSMAALLRAPGLASTVLQAASGASGGSTRGPLMHVERMEVRNPSDVDLALQRAEFRGRMADV